MGIVEFVQDRLNEDEQWARLCSQPPEGEPELPNGVHWRWTRGPDQTTIRIPEKLDEDADPFLTEYGTLAWLATVETWTFGEGEEAQEGSGSYFEGVSNVELDAAAHIARHDPARILAEVSAKRALLEMVLADQNTNGGKNSSQWNQVMRLLALPYRGHPQYRKSWAPR